MRKLKVGDVVNMNDGSYCFGVQHGGYSRNCDNTNGDRERLTVVETGLKAMANCDDDQVGQWCAVCDILVSGHNGLWFTQSALVSLSDPEEEMITLSNGKKYSETTILEALRQHVG